MGWIALLAVFWVVFEYIFIGSSRAIPIQKFIKIHLSEFKPSGIKIIQKQEIPFVLIHRSKATISQLKQSYLDNPLRSISEEYFISLAIGSDLGCVVTQYQNDQLKESCSYTFYDQSGRVLNKQLAPLIVPKMSYNEVTQYYNITLD